MLTSSDAKWRCLWHMFVWSILLTLVSQFLVMTDHIAFYIFGSLAMLVLPVITATYSNTEGRRGAELIRVAYVICDPVIACFTITPVLLLNHLPVIVDHYSCVVANPTSWNATCGCVENLTDADPLPPCDHLDLMSPNDLEQTAIDLSARFVTIQMSMSMAALLSLLMGRRTSKMNFNTYSLTFAYWFVISIEAVDMLETIRLGDIYQRVIYTTMVIVSITMIITNSYAIVTLCSFISPTQGASGKHMDKEFDFIYRVILGCFGILFTEIPLLVARFQILTADMTRILPATFYLWFVKDFLFMFLIIAIVLTQKINKRYVVKLPCKMHFDNPDIVFQPEKRDAYIERKKQVTFQDPPATTFDELCERSPPGGSTKQPPSVLKNGSSSLVFNNNCSNYTPNATPKMKKLVNIDSADSTKAGVKLSDTFLCLPLTDHPSSSLSGSPKFNSGARPKILDPEASRHLKKSTKLLEDYDSSDSDLVAGVV